MKRLDLTGKKINKLTIIGYSHSHIQPSGQKRAMWDVLCECGIKKKMSTSTLIGGSTISCGCYLKKIRKDGLHKIAPGEANFNAKFNGYKSRARRHNKNLEFSLTKEEFRKIIKQNCHYCGCEPKMHHTKRNLNGLFISNGIDRIDPSKGYILENCLPCCKDCNIMKNDMSYIDFLAHIKRIASYVEKR